MNNVNLMSCGAHASFVFGDCIVTFKRYVGKVVENNTNVAAVIGVDNTSAYIDVVLPCETRPRSCVDRYKE